MKVSPHPLRRRSATLRAVAALLALLTGSGILNQPAFAGDILRGGATTGAPVGATSPTGVAPPTVSPSAGGGTRDSLARTAQAIQAMQAIQTAARNVANQSGANHAIKNPSSGGQLINVPDGLGKGGLQIDPGVTKAGDPLWTGADLPTQTSTSGGTTTVTVKQTAQQAVLNWETFNVGKNTTLNFDQSQGGANAGQWIAFNKVNDPMANPSQILGTIKAQGQVYVINRNGIVFGGASQVNVHALVASTLSINDNLVKQGLLNNPNNEFLFSGLGGDPNTKVGDVIVEAGAQLTAPTSSEKVGGRIALIGANVINDGTISTTDGQTILAAGLQVAWAAHASSDPSLRGLDTYVGKVVDPSSSLSGYAGTVTNNGIIDAGRANVTLAGKNVQQLGAITSTTSVSFNGRIDLLASYDALGNPAAASNAALSPFVNSSTGSVTLGDGSVTQILPELDSKDTVIGSALALRSQINIQGQQVHFEENSLLYAPNAIVKVDAGTWNTSIASNVSEFNHNTGQINVDDGALIDVSGSKNVQSSVTSNIVKVELRGSELADSPLLRDGALRGQTIYIDISEAGVYNGKAWVGTPLADVSGYVNLVQHTVGELTAAGGTVSLNAGGAVVVRNGATVDVSGGTINYAGGVVQTSRVYAGKQIFDISDATPDRAYDGVYRGGSITKSKAWGVTEQFTNPITLNGTRYQEGYTQGGNGGTLNITGGSVAVDGSLKGSTYTGVRQRTIGPVASSLNISLSADRILPSQTLLTHYSPNGTDIVFSNTNNQQPLADYAVDSNGNPLDLPQERIDKLILSPELLGDNGFGNLSVRSANGDISVEKGVTLQTSPRGSISFSGANIDIQGSLISAGGTLSFTTYDVSPDTVTELHVNNGKPPVFDPTRGQFTLGSSATLNTAGYLVDDRPTSSTLLQTPMVTNGGAVTINSLSADLAAGSLIDVSGGVAATGGGKYNWGNAGSISVQTGRDPAVKGIQGGHLTLGGELRGMSGAKGGSLTLQASTVQIGGDPASAASLHLSTDFFNQGGFSSFTVNGVGNTGNTSALLIAGGAKIAPVVQSWLASEVDGAISLSTYVQPAGLRAPVSLSFGAGGMTDEFNSGNLIARGDVKVGAGAVIDAGAAGSIALNGQTDEVHGTLLAAGGSITITGESTYPSLNGGNETVAKTTVLIGSDAVLNAAGTVLLVPDSFGRQRGAVLGGGRISITGNTVAEKGALLDVSGTSGQLDLLPGESGQSLADLAYGASGTTSRPYNMRGKSTKVDSNGGSITLTGGQMLLTDATLVGKAGGSTAAGGTLSVSSGIFLVSGTTPPQSPTIVLTQSGPVIPDTYTAGIENAIPADSTGLQGGGRFAIDSFTAGGFDNLDIGGVVKAVGPVAIKADGRVTLGNGPVLYADSTLSVDASYVKIGAPFKNPRQPQENQDDYTIPGTSIPQRLPATYGTGSLSISGDLIDVGDLSLQGIGTASLVANNGDIRGSGTLAIAGDLSLTAGQIYPPTALQFTLAAFDYQSGGVTHSGSVTISGSGKRSLPLSAGGTLAVYATNIVQNGTLRAPFGNIILGWDGTGTAPFDHLTGANAPKTASVTLGAKSVTSVSAIDPITGKALTMPYGTSLDGTTWLDPTGKDITNGGLPQKSITLSGDAVISEKGSQVDIRGGGDLFAYRFVAGNGGSTDILASSGSFAIIPGYAADYAPYAPFSTTSKTALGNDPGYVNNSLQVGQQVYLDGSTGVPAGIYTLLPARYALMPGAYLVTPKSGSAVGTRLQPDGSRIVSGYLVNGMDDSVDPTAVRTRFEVASAQVVNSRAEYSQFLANSFLTSTGGFRLPGDSGQLVLSATKAMAIAGQVASAASGNFRGGLIDISSAGDILITNGTPASTPANTLVVDVNLLSGFGAESLLIGGIRSAESDGTLVTVNTGNVTLDNAGAALTGPEIILAAKQGVTLASGAQIRQSGKSSGATDTLIIGNALADGATPTGSGNGALVRVNHGDTGSLIRRDVIPGQGASLSIGSGASLKGDSITLDSTASTLIGAGASLTADNLSLSSGRISLSLDPSITPGADAGLVLSSDIIRELASSSSLSLSSYSSIDLLGSGVVGGRNGAGKPAIDSLSLHAAAIRGIGVGSTGTVEFDADQIEIGGLSGAVAPSGPAQPGGLLSFRSSNLRLGSGAVNLLGFSQVDMTATKEVRTTANGSLSATGGLTVNTPLLTSDSTVKYAVTSAGALKVTGSGVTGAVTTAGLASSLSLTGSSVDLGSRIVLPSGVISATATGGDLNVTGSLEAGGAAQRFKTQTRYTDAGALNLTASGNIELAQGSSLDVSAKSGGGDAGSITLAAKNGTVGLDGTLNGKGSTSGKNGSIAIQVNKLPLSGGTDTLSGQPLLSVYDKVLDSAFFTESREYRVSTGDVVVDGTAHAHSYTVSTDKGAITVTGTIDASGKEGGTVRLVADTNLTLASTALIDASGDDFSSSGKGGSVTLETRGDSSGVINLVSGSKIDLSVATNKGADSAKAGDFGGVLHLRAPQNAAGTDIAVGALNSTVTGASAIIVEGYKTYDLSNANGATITTAVQNQVKTDATAFMTNADTIESRILGAGSTLGSLTTVRPGAEIINTKGDLTLGTATSTSTSDWNLASYRFGGEQVPGILTLRAAGNLVFYNTLSDGFTTSTYTSGLLANNTNLSDNAESWSFRLVSGADFSAADTRKVVPVTVADNAALGSAAGSVKIGKNAGFYSSGLGPRALTSDAANRYFQVIRTGSGDIDVVAAGDVQLLNQFASIYTAGTQTSDPTLGGTFVNPVTFLSPVPINELGLPQQPSQAPIQFSLGGGDVNVTAGNDIIHLTLYTDPNTGITGYVQDSQREMPSNWLYRRGYVDPATGQFGLTRNRDVASTTWWVDFTNFFDGVAALGGGDVNMTAGRDVSNVDASTPTNARMPGGKPDASKLVELGGGDISVTAGRNINAGVYYVERGHGSLTAGASIITNSSRAPSTGAPSGAPTDLDPSTWLPTTLFVGKSSFDITAGGDILLGPAANPFLLPQSLNNSPYNKTWFSTYSQDAGVTVASYGGDVTLREMVTLPGSGFSESMLHAWYSTQLMYDPGNLSKSYYQPWLRLSENSVDPFEYAFTLMPGTLKMTSFNGDVNVVGSITLSPSATGTVELLASNAVNGLQPTGINTINGLNNRVWVPAVINLSDADPSALPGITTPFAYQQIVGTTGSGANSTQSTFLLAYSNLFAETGSTEGALQDRQSRHSLVNGQPLHADDTQPVRIYSDSGDISGLTLFSAKSAEILSGQDLRDISFYIQNLHTTDVSIVAASRDIIAYDQGTAARIASQAPGNETSATGIFPAGDIQVSGQGALEVFAGRNLDLGIGQTSVDGSNIGSGITSVGNSRNPYLTFAGAEIIAAAGFDATSLTGSKADFAAFVTKFVNTDDGAAHLKELGLTPEQFAALGAEDKDEATLKVFFMVLRDTGRHHNDPDNDNFGTYKEGQEAVATLFPGTDWKGDIDTRSRNIRTRNGGDITLFAPGGGLRLAQSVIGSPQVPPGIITEAGGNINIATNGDVNLGISRIFTLRGGNEIIWSTHGDIAAGSSSKTIQSAPPTRVLLDPQSGDVKTDLAGLATGGGIGVLSTVTGVKAADVDLIAPEGTIDAGDAGIRVTGNINLAAAVVANAGNITAGGTSSGTSSGPAAPSVAALTSASNSAVASTAPETNTAQQNSNPEPKPAVLDAPSDISVEVVGYGGDDEDTNVSSGTSAEEEEEKRKRRQQQQQQLQDSSAQPGETTPPASGH